MPNFYNTYPYFQQPQVPVQSQPQIQNGGFVSVRNEAEARNYPIAIGTSITFKDENAPYIYTKTMGFSQFEPPKFEKYKLTKEDPAETPTSNDKSVLEKNGKDTTEETKREIEALWSEIEYIKAKIATKTAPSKKKEVSGNDE